MVRRFGGWAATAQPTGAEVGADIARLRCQSYASAALRAWTAEALALRARIGHGPIPLAALDPAALAILAARGQARLLLDGDGRAVVTRVPR
jgi:hypothetical protein